MHHLTPMLISLMLLLFHLSLQGQEEYGVKAIKVSGNEVIPEKTLVRQMNTVEESIRDKFMFWQNKPEFSSSLLENDINRLITFYKRQGFLNAQIDYQIKKIPKRHKLSVHIQVWEGRPVLLGKIRISEPPEANQTGIYRELMDQLSLKEGARFTDDKVFSAEQKLEQAYKDNGYPLVTIRRDIQVRPEQFRAGIDFLVYPGKKMHFGTTTILGNTHVSERFIRRKLTYQKGDLFSAQAINQTQQQIFYTDLFSYAITRAEKDSIQDDRIPVTIRLKELPQWNLEGGVGYGTEDRFRFWFQVKKLNFLGGARRIILEGKHSYFIPAKLDLRLIQPELFSPKANLIVNPFYIHARERSFEVRRLGSSLMLQTVFSRKMNGYFNYEMQKVQVNPTGDSIREEGYDKAHNKSGFTLGAGYNSVDQGFNPASGWKIDGYTSYMGVGFRSKYHYLKTGVSLSTYRRIPGEWVWAGRIKAGVIQPLRGSASSPIEERFFSGGARSLRGWGRHEISPLNDKGQLIGGNSIFETSTELRFPVYKIIHGVVFLDAGNVWSQAFTFQPGNLRYNAGTGLRVKTPVGPVRLDVAKPLFEGDHSLQLYISLGHAF